MAISSTDQLLEIENLDILTAGAKHALASTWRSIHKFLEHNPDSALEPVQIGKHGKKALLLDVIGERIFETKIKDYDGGRFGQILDLYGEETLRDPDIDLSNHNKLCVLVDIIDGTDLLERGLGNWCSAVVFFLPTAPDGQKILGSFVLIPPGDLYFTTLHDTHVWRLNIRQPKKTTKVSGVSNVKDLHNSSICFYGQKAKNFAAISQYRLFRSIINKELSNGFRLYTLAGIPMIIKLIDHTVKTARAIDAVFEVVGQKPHDVVPGAYLALRAGATVRNLITNKDMTLIDLEKYLMCPAAESSALKYVVASSRELADTLSDLLQLTGSSVDDRISHLSNTPISNLI